MANLVVSAVSTWDNKGLKKGQKDISAFDKGLKSLGKTLGAVFAVSTIVNFSKHAVDAFSKDQAAAKALEQQLKNTGYAFSAPDIEYYIANLQAMTGVLDDQLRPAFQTLLTASGSLTKSQKALAIALDVSAATGKSVEEVSAAIAKGYTGQTTALSRLGAGLDKTTLASGDMSVILDELGNKFSGQSQARLETYAGKMDLLKVSAANASETIGKGLLDSLSMIGKDQNIANLGSSLEKLATTIANVVVGLGSILGRVISIGEAIFSKLHLDKVIGFLYNNSLIAKLASFGASEAAKPKSNFSYSLGTGAGTEIAKAKEAALLKKTNAARAAELAALNKKNAVDKLKDQFDLERIGLMAALNAATDDETKLRLKAQLAILDNNEALAKKLLAEMEAARKAKELADAFNGTVNALTEWQRKVMALGAQIEAKAAAKGLTSGSSGTAFDPSFGGAPVPSNPLYNYNSMPQSTFDSSNGVRSLPLLSNANPYGDYNLTPSTPLYQYNIAVDATSMVDANNMERVIQQTILNINKSGLSTIPAGQGF